MGRIFVTILLLLGLAETAPAKDVREVTLATLTDFAPYCFARDRAQYIPAEHIPPGSDSLQLQGYSWDVVRESFHAMGYSVRLLVVPWERSIHYLTSGKVDLVFPANKTVEREKNFVFTKEYVDQIETVVYMRQNENFAWGGLGSLDGLAIGFVRGWSYGKRWEGADRIVKESMDTISQGFAMLGKGRLVGLAGYKRAYNHVLKASGQTSLFKIVGQFDTIDEFLMGRRADDGVVQPLQAFDQGKRKIRENGIMQQIEGKWQQ